MKIDAVGWRVICALMLAGPSFCLSQSAMVTGVTADGRVTLNVGSADGVKVGARAAVVLPRRVAGRQMELRVARIQVVYVDARSSDADVTEIANSFRLDDLKAGMHVAFYEPLVPPAAPVAPPSASAPPPAEQGKGPGVSIEFINVPPGTELEECGASYTLASVPTPEGIVDLPASDYCLRFVVEGVPGETELRLAARPGFPRPVIDVSRYRPRGSAKRGRSRPARERIPEVDACSRVRTELLDNRSYVDAHKWLNENRRSLSSEIYGFLRALSDAVQATRRMETDNTRKRLQEAQRFLSGFGVDVAECARGLFGDLREGLLLPVGFEDGDEAGPTGTSQQLGHAAQGVVPVVIRHKETGLAFRLVPGLTFGQGCVPRAIGETRSCDLAEQPQHSVTVADFWMMTTETPLAAYRRFVRDRGLSIVLPARTTGDDEYPARSVPWGVAEQFCRWLGARLPSESEWELAARSNGGASIVDWETIGGVGPGEVRHGDAGKLGIYHLLGNVEEWVQDVWHSDYRGAPRHGRPWVDGADPDYRVLRGGTFAVHEAEITPWRRNMNLMDVHFETIGFRCAVSVEGPPTAFAVGR